MTRRSKPPGVVLGGGGAHDPALIGSVLPACPAMVASALRPRQPPLLFLFLFLFFPGLFLLQRCQPRRRHRRAQPFKVGAGATPAEPLTSTRSRTSPPLPPCGRGRPSRRLRAVRRPLSVPPPSPALTANKPPGTALFHHFGVGHAVTRLPYTGELRPTQGTGLRVGVDADGTHWTRSPWTGGVAWRTRGRPAAASPGRGGVGRWVAFETAHDESAKVARRGRHRTACRSVRLLPPHADRLHDNGWGCAIARQTLSVVPPAALHLRPCATTRHPECSAKIGDKPRASWDPNMVGAIELSYVLDELFGTQDHDRRADTTSLLKAESWRVWTPRVRQS